VTAQQYIAQQRTYYAAEYARYAAEEKAEAQRENLGAGARRMPTKTVDQARKR
jgi:predicted dithiol-disulfide oxidoreductase (DUF899 family)